MTLQRIVWMNKGAQRFRRTMFKVTQEDAWWRTSWLLAEVHNGFLAQVQSWGGASGERPKQPKDMNPLEVASDRTPAIDHQSEAAFALAAQQEAVKRNGKQERN